MIRFVKAVVIGYATLWVVEWFQKTMQEEKVDNLEDLKRLIKKKL